MGGISIWQLLIVAVIVVLIFGTKKLSSLGADLGTSIKGFKNAMSDEGSQQNKDETSVPDADFPPKSLSETQHTTTNVDAKHHHSEQV